MFVVESVPPILLGSVAGTVVDRFDRRHVMIASDLLRALAAPVRIAIVLQLRESSRCVHELVDALGVPQPLVSQHLRILKAAGVSTK